jgi:hypothetical protein
MSPTIGFDAELTKVGSVKSSKAISNRLFAGEELDLLKTTMMKLKILP